MSNQTAEIICVALRDGSIVLGKLCDGSTTAKTFANRSQAERAAQLNNGEVVRRGRPFFVRIGAISK